jgi:hypothetical protein
MNQNRYQSPLIIVLLLLAFFSSVQPLQAAGRTVLTKNFDIQQAAIDLTFSVIFFEIFDDDMWDKIESGVTKPILYGINLIDADEDIEAEIYYWIKIRYDALVEIPIYELTYEDGTVLQIAERNDVMKFLGQFNQMKLAKMRDVRKGVHTIRIIIKVNPWTEDQLARLNQDYRPLGNYNILKTALFDNSQFRPQREFYIYSQQFSLMNGITPEKEDE